MNTEAEKKQKTWGVGRLLRHFWPYLKRHPFLLGISIFSMVLYTFIGRLFPMIVGYIVDSGIELKEFSNVILGFSVYCLCVVVHAFCNFGQHYLFQRYGNRIIFYIRQDLMEHLQRLPLSFFDKTPRGKIATRIINDSTKMGQLFSSHISSTLSYIISSISILFLMFYISPKLSFISLSLSPLFLWLAWRVNFRLHRMLHVTKRTLSKINTATVENLQGMEVLQVHHKKQEKAQSFGKSCTEYSSQNIGLAGQNARLRITMTLFQASILVLSLIVGVQMKWEGALSIGALTAFLINIQHLAPYLRMILENYQSLQDSMTSTERVFFLFQQPAESQPYGIPSPALAVHSSAFSGQAEKEKARPSSFQRQQGHLQIKNVSFRYGPKEPWALKDIHLNIEPGQSLAIVGRTGSGKSTLASLLQKNYPLQVGEILLDGQSIENIPPSQLRKQLGLIRQDDFIFSGSLLNNITLKDPAISADKACRILNEIGYQELLEKTHRDMYFTLAEGGKNISLGEQQLIALARLFVNEPQVVILDEANAHIDFKYEIILQKLIQRIAKKHTCIIISHKIHNIVSCDSIVVLDQGRIAQRGSHLELLEKNPIYQDYVQKYFLSVIPQV